MYTHFKYFKYYISIYLNFALRMGHKSSYKNISQSKLSLRSVPAVLTLSSSEKSHLDSYLLESSAMLQQTYMDKLISKISIPIFLEK